MFKKIIYIYITVIIGVIVYSISNYVATGNNLIKNIQNIASTNIKDEKYDEVARIFTQFVYEDEALVYQSDDALMIVYYSGVVESVEKEVNGEKMSISTFEKGFSVYLFNLDEEIKLGDKSSTNKASFEVTSENGTKVTSLLYPYADDGSIIKELEDSKQVGRTDMLYMYDTVDYLFVDLAFNDFANTPIMDITFKDSEGNSVISTSEIVDYKPIKESDQQAFYDELGTFATSYNEKVLNTDNANRIEEANQIFAEYTAKVDAEGSKVLRSYGQDELYNKTSILINTLIPVAIYLAIMVVIGYFLIFRRKKNSYVQQAKAYALNQKIVINNKNNINNNINNNVNNNINNNINNNTVNNNINNKTVNNNANNKNNE